MKTVWLVAIHHHAVSWPQVLSAHEDEASARAAACRDNYRADGIGCLVFHHPHDHQPTRIVICMEVQP